METLAKEHVHTVLDILGGRLTFERTGVKLYDAVIRKIEQNGDPRYLRLLGQLRKIRTEEKEHEEWLEEQIRALGGDAHGTTTLSQLETEEAAGIQNVILDGHQQVSHLLHALLAAELADNAGWDLLIKLAEETGDVQAKRGFQKRMADEAKHLAFIREAVLRAAEVEILGRDEEMPSDLEGIIARRAFKAPVAFVLGGVGLFLLGIGAARLLRG